MEGSLGGSGLGTWPEEQIPLDAGGNRLQEEHMESNTCINKDRSGADTDNVQLLFTVAWKAWRGHRWETRGGGGVREREGQKETKTESERRMVSSYSRCHHDYEKKTHLAHSTFKMRWS